MKKVSLFIIICIVLLSACSAISRDFEEEFNFYEQVAFRATDNGWLYFMSIQTLRESGEIIAYEFNAVNIKYSYLENFIITVLDYDTREIIDTIIPSIPTLNLNPKYELEIFAIHDFFNENRPKDVLTLNDLAILELKHINKNLLLELFNEAITGETVPAGRYFALPFANLVQEWNGEARDGYLWQVAYLNIRGQVLFVRIDIVYIADILCEEDEMNNECICETEHISISFLSDKIKFGEASIYQIDIWNIISAIERGIVSENHFGYSDLKNNNISNIDFGRLIHLLNGIHTGELR